jgi:hypothetical protein
VNDHATTHGTILTSDDVASIALDGIEAGLVYILTHTDSARSIRVRIDSVLADLTVVAEFLQDDLQDPQPKKTPRSRPLWVTTGLELGVAGQSPSPMFVGYRAGILAGLSYSRGRTRWLQSVRAFSMCTHDLSQPRLVPLDSAAGRRAGDALISRPPS